MTSTSTDSHSGTLVARAHRHNRVRTPKGWHWAGVRAIQSWLQTFDEFVSEYGNTYPYFVAESEWESAYGRPPAACGGGDGNGSGRAEEEEAAVAGA